MAQNTKVVKACKAMKSYGISEETVKPVLKTLLDLYDMNWKHIEDENYRVLLDAIFDNGASKSEEETRTQEYSLIDEPEESEPSPLNKWLRSQKDRSSPSPSGGSPTDSSIIPYMRKKRISDSSQKSEPPVLSFALSLIENVIDKTREEGTHVDVVDDDDGTLCEIPLAVILPGVDCSSHENFGDAQENYFELIDRDEESPQDGPSKEDFSNLEANALEILNPQLADKKKDDEPKSTNIDIASSLNGGVKIALIHNTSNQSNGLNRSIDSVLKAVEEKWVKSYGITKSGFSLLNMMKDVCEFFLLDDTTSNSDEQVGPINIQPTSQMGPSNFINFSNGPLKLHIPRSLTSTGFDFLQFIKGINVNSDVFSGIRVKKSNIFACQDSSSSRAIVIAQKQNSYYVDDITKGEEEMKISLVNEINNEQKPTFCYIPKNIRYQNAYVKFILARISDDNCCTDCFGDCTSRALPCACAGETGGEFAYTQEGLVKEKFLEECVSMNRNPQKHNLFYCKDCPLERSKGKSLLGKCKGHFVRSFIKECWYKCGCSYNCGNRVVQRGITVNLQVFMTPQGKGWGLRTLEEIPKGVFVCEYVGEIVTNTELFERNEKQNKGEKHTYPVLLDADWGSEGVLKDEEALCLDATFCGNVARFVNHRCCDANMVEIPVEVETPDHHYYHLAFFTTRKVNALEELTWDYGVDFDDHIHPVKAFQCRCGSKFCRNIKRRKRARSS